LRRRRRASLPSPALGWHAWHHFAGERELLFGPEALAAVRRRDDFEREGPPELRGGGSVIERPWDNAVGLWRSLGGRASLRSQASWWRAINASRLEGMLSAARRRVAGRRAVRSAAPKRVAKRQVVAGGLFVSASTGPVGRSMRLLAAGCWILVGVSRA
jgi:hypothetical protein